MDVFFEQIVPLKKTAKDYLLISLTVIGALSLCAACIFFSGALPILLPLTVLIIYGAIKLLARFNKEVEYIVTNGSVDFDVITAKSSRKRVITFECKDILRGGKYNPANPVKTDANETLILGNVQNAKYVLVKRGGKKYLIVFSPNDKIISGIKQGAPREMSRDLFND